MRSRMVVPVLVLIAACARGEADADSTPVAAAQPADRATTAATVANAIAANPASADSILAANNLTRDSFQALMYEIAADSAMSATYASVKRR